MEIKVEQYQLSSTRFVPNNQVPVLIYRDVLPTPRTEESVTEFLTRHGAWEKKGTWGHDDRRHYHPNSHECYGVFQGRSVLRLGVGKNDEEEGRLIGVETGDVIVLPAGTGHCNKESSEDYRFIGVYPSVSYKTSDGLLQANVSYNGIHWRNEYGDRELDWPAMRKEVGDVRIPESDPVTGVPGPLLEAWAAGS